MRSYYFEHIKYEMDMYRRSWKLLDTAYGRIGSPFHNSLYESHLLHLRNLIDFFSNAESKHDDDILISKVLINYEGYSIKITKELRDMINKSVQHLSTYRAEFLDKAELSKNIIELYPIVIERIERFEKDIQNPDNLQEKYRVDFEEYLEEKKRL